MFIVIGNVKKNRSSKERMWEKKKYSSDEGEIMSKERKEGIGISRMILFLVTSLTGKKGRSSKRERESQETE